ncbi:nicotinamide riboside transporter PnuC [Paenibacillus thailandensis]|uniref:Nicotinamide riboside transporter PnuC n=1 Tax=Paenibacillus thailandensis TaxID=393250 RepID=A0ABW5R082_9BACL
MKKGWTLLIASVWMAAIAVYTSSTTLEVVATATGLLSVWLTARENIWAWPVGLVNVGCFFFMFEEAKLYADMTLQIFFFILSVYGWAVWLMKREGADVRPTRRIKMGTAVWLGALAVVLSAVWGYVLETYTDASIPYADAFIATFSLVAQYLLSSKVLENWICWVAVDVMSIAMYAYKELYALSFLYVIFLLIAASGYVSWRRELRQRERGLTVWQAESAPRV